MSEEKVKRVQPVTVTPVELGTVRFAIKVYTADQIDEMIDGLPDASDADPLMDGEASPGSSEAYSRGDHRHPRAIWKTSDLENDGEDGTWPFQTTKEAQFKAWYPDGSVTDESQFTQTLKYSFDAANRTATVLAFVTDGEGDSNADATGDIVIPPYKDYNGVRYDVTAIGDFGDQGPPSGSSITALKAPTTVTQMGWGAFMYCSSLTTVSLPACTNVGDGAFDSCTSLTTVSLPACTSVGDVAFADCTSLTSVYLPACAGVGEAAFSSCTLLASVDFGPGARDSVPTLRSDAFYDVPTTCKIIVPDANYDAWTAQTLPDGETANPWYALVQAGYMFIKYSQWEVRLRYELHEPMIETTWSDLMDARDGGILVPGLQYRITDYVATTVQENTQSANKQFDIIVVADDDSTLNENARAIQHSTSSSDYFHDSDLAAWELKYCLDNDTSRFAWADSANGKGVVFWMKDEWGNECPYDFKGIKFARWELSNGAGYIFNHDTLEWDPDADGKLASFLGLKDGLYAISSSNSVFEFGYDGAYKVEYTISQNPTYVFTFGTSDYSVSGSNVRMNRIATYVSSDKRQLNNIVFLNTDGGCFLNTFGYNCTDNTFGTGCYSNTLGDECANNTFGDGCFRNTLGDECPDNTFGTGCYSNTLGDICFHNTFGDSCFYNTLGDECANNTFGDGFFRNTLGDECANNTFGDGCQYSTFGDSCFYNTFGDGCQHNTFGGDCSDNTFGLDPTSPDGYFKYIDFEPGVNNVNLCYLGAETLDYEHMVLNITVSKGVTSVQIDVTDVNQVDKTTYQTYGSQTITI